MSSNENREVLASFRDVYKFYEKDGEYLTALKGINLDIYKHEFLCIVGPTGSGKSTILRMLAGLDKHSMGDLSLHGQPIKGPGRDRGMIFQEYSLLPWRNLEQNIELGMEFDGTASGQRAETAKKFVDLVGLGYAKHKNPWECSGGMKRRASLAMILAMTPEILLMDGAFNALDAKTKMTLQTEILDIWDREDTTILFVTSELDEAVKLGQRILVLNSSGEIADIIDNPLPYPRLGKASTSPEFTRKAAEVREQVLDVMLNSSSEDRKRKDRPLLELRNVFKVFTKEGEDFLALQDVNLSVNDGEFMCILGPTGCGKSVTLNIVAGLYEQTAGEVILDGKPEKGPGAHKGMIFQEYALLPWRTVVENVEFGLELAGFSKAERHAIALEQLENVGLLEAANLSIHDISMGARQRVAIARALANRPKILLMDEPFDALDALSKAEMQVEILKTWEKTKKTIFFVTHDVDEAIFISDRITVMDINPGRVKAVLDNKLPRPRHEKVKRTDDAFAEMRDQIIGLYSSLMEDELDLIV